MSQPPTTAQALAKKKSGSRKFGLQFDPAELRQLRKAEAKIIIGEKKEQVLSKEELRTLGKAEARLIVDDGEPVDNTFSEKQQRLLTQTLYSSWTPPGEKGSKTRRKFWTAANVGIFSWVHKSGIAPDVFVSLDVEPPTEAIRKAYFYWDCGKFPELVIEIVSNTRGGEISRKHNRYEQMGIPYYVVLDPFLYFKGEVLRVFTLQDGVYQPTSEHFFPCLGLGLKLWRGTFEDITRTYLRWCDGKGKLLPTADERTERAAERAKRESERAKRESKRAATLAAKLRELGVDPNKL